MRKRSGRIAVAAVLFVLGFLVVVQLRSQAADQGLNGLSVQELTRAGGQPDDPQQPAARGDPDARAPARPGGRGRRSAATPRPSRCAPTSTASSAGPGPCARHRCRGAGDRSPGRCRATPSSRCSTSCATPAPRRSRSATRGSWRATSRTARAARCSSGTRRSADPIELVAVGQPQTLAGSLTRAGGPIAQLAARYPDVVITVERGGPRRPARRRSGRSHRSSADRVSNGFGGLASPVPATLCYPAGRCPAIPCSRCCWATWSGSGAATRAAATPGSIDRLGADIGLRCTTCDRHVLIERPALERRIVELREAR